MAGWVVFVLVCMGWCEDEDKKTKRDANTIRQETSRELTERIEMGPLTEHSYGACSLWVDLGFGFTTPMNPRKCDSTPKTSNQITNSTLSGPINRTNRDGPPYISVATSKIRQEQRIELTNRRDWAP